MPWQFTITIREFQPYIFVKIHTKLKGNKNYTKPIYQNVNKPYAESHIVIDYQLCFYFHTYTTVQSKYGDGAIIRFGVFSGNIQILYTQKDGFMTVCVSACVCVLQTSLMTRVISNLACQRNICIGIIIVGVFSHKKNPNIYKNWC